jgi:predicted house-cleaning noncanonical NTP pyrophosphatase (MazG superfamily)
MSDLMDFLENRMSMTEVYQPVVIRELILSGGRQSKAKLARALAEYDTSVEDYYMQVIMRWPKATLEKHGIVKYEKKTQAFVLCDLPNDSEVQKQVVSYCDRRIAEWTDRKAALDKQTQLAPSLRYIVLKSAHGKCQLCGVSSSIRPIDVDHIVPKSKANKQRKVKIAGKLVDLDSIDNLQALCFQCNRAKRDLDDTDFRKKQKLVRDRVPDIIRSAGREPLVKRLTGKALTSALLDKLTEELAELLSAVDQKQILEEIGDLIEAALALAHQYGATEDAMSSLRAAKNSQNGAFTEGYLYSGDA